MVTEKLPAPRFDRGWRAEQNEGVGPLAQHMRPTDEITEKLVEAHDGARGLESSRAETCGHNSEHGLAYGWRNLVESQPMMLDQDFCVLPLLPHRRADGEAGGSLLRGCQQREQCGRGRAAIGSHGAPDGLSENNPGRTVPSVVSPLNGASASLPHVENSSCARGLFKRASACARGVSPAMRDFPGSGTKGL